MVQDTYRMPRSEAEAKRLNEQGLVIERALDYQIHPNILKNLPSNAVIADVGTGTGDYLIRLSQTSHPDYAFHGFDISARQFQDQNSLPSNVHLHVHDFKSPFPDRFNNTFDLIHLRLLVAAMNEEDWSIATANLIKLLKPGGAIQWEEGDFITGRRLRGGPAGTTARNLAFALQPMVNLFSDRYAFGYSTLPTIFKEQNLHSVDVDVVSTDRVFENRKLMGRLSIEAVMMWAKVKRAESVDGEGGDFWGGISIEEIERLAYEDLEAGAYAQFDIYCAIGFRSKTLEFS